jgi:hypothetical protein
MLGSIGWRIVGLVLVHRWVQGRSGGGRKGTEPAHGSVLFQTASPPQHAKFQWSLSTTEASKVSCEWTESTPPNNAILRVSVFDEWPI